MAVEHVYLTLLPKAAAELRTETSHLPKHYCHLNPTSPRRRPGLLGVKERPV